MQRRSFFTALGAMLAAPLAWTSKRFTVRGVYPVTMNRMPDEPMWFASRDGVYVLNAGESFGVRYEYDAVVNAVIKHDVLK